MHEEQRLSSWLSDDRHHVLKPGEPDYPAALAEIHDPPPVLYADGDISCLDDAVTRIAMVGSRRATPYGLRQARDIARELSAAGVTVVSGLAIGIDTASHEGALAPEGGRTIAVLGSGIDVVYPKRNWRLADRIRRDGLLLSEFPLGTASYPANFPRRNRIVTGISSATLVVEAALNSGSLISAELAISQGRDVFAMPGPVTGVQSRGCHRLLRDGAALVESAADVLVELGIDVAHAPALDTRPRLTDSQAKLLESLAAGPLSMDMLCEVSGLAIDELAVSLVSLEIAGLVESEAGLYYPRGPG